MVHLRSMHRPLRNLLLLIALVGGINCSTTEPNSNTDSSKLGPPEVDEYCTIRPGVCGHEHQPVCALQRTRSWSTYPNACQACQDSFVLGYRPGRCYERPTSPPGLSCRADPLQKSR